MQATDVQMIADRWMLESRRLINWGSYEGYHEFRPRRWLAERAGGGHASHCG